MSKNLLLIKRLKIQNANAQSSPYSIGFPAITAWLGAAHALQRKLQQQTHYDGLEDLIFMGVGIVSHNFYLHTYKNNNQFEQDIIATGNPLDKSGKRPSFVEEPRCNLTLSLILEFDTEDHNDLIDAVYHTLPKLKMAGGDILPFKKEQISLLHLENDYEIHSLTAQLMPGFCLIERQDIMQTAMQTGQDALDALLDTIKITHSCSTDDTTNKTTWQTQKQQKGWIIPIGIGFQGISPPQKTQQQRDPDTPHRFAESVVTLAEFIMPYRLETIQDILWYYQPDLKNDLYLCQQQKPSST
ncbi:MAG TPA: type I-F CRISPR-associated protein Csy2 [Chromatiaceae bacterium]|nr:type I-F CRISPR-associated protein Csy2 [Chromatiaceae bacterium]